MLAGVKWSELQKQVRGQIALRFCSKCASFPLGVIIYTRTKPVENKWPYAITRLTAHFVCGLITPWCLIWWIASLEKACPCRDEVSLNKPFKCASRSKWSELNVKFALLILLHDADYILCMFQAARPLISVYTEKGEVSKDNVTLPAVFQGSHPPRHREQRTLRHEEEQPSAICRLCQGW